MANIRKCAKRTPAGQKYRVFVCINGTRASRVIYAKNDKEARRQAGLLEEMMCTTGRINNFRAYV